MSGFDVLKLSDSYGELTIGMFSRLRQLGVRDMTFTAEAAEYLEWTHSSKLAPSVRHVPTICEDGRRKFAQLFGMWLYEEAPPPEPPKPADPRDFHL